MGVCSSAQNDQSKADRNKKEEKWLISNELALGFDRVTVGTISKVLEQYADCEKINDNMLLDFLSDLSMATIGIDDPSNDIGKFYQSLKDGNQFEMDMVAVLATLLGKGNKVEKASLLFKRFNVQGIVPKEKFEKMLSIMIFLSVEALPLLATDHSDTSIDAQQLRIYLTNLQNAEQRFCHLIWNEFYGHDIVITKQEFKGKYWASKFTKPSRVRKAMRAVTDLRQSCQVNPFVFDPQKYSSKERRRSSVSNFSCTN